MALINVLLPVFNGQPFLAAAIDSICRQSVDDWRLLILDHGSNDGSRECAESYAERDRRIEVHSFPSARGLSGLLNKGLDLSDCRYILRHDADDIAYPDRMRDSLDAFDVQADCAAIGGQADLIDGSGDKTGQVFRPTERMRISAGCFFWNPVIHPTTILDLDFINKKGIRYGVDFLKVVDESHRIEVPGLAEDYLLFGQLALLGKCGNSPRKLIQYRYHGANVGAENFLQQMKVSVGISRFLMKSFCSIHGVAYVDPAPFCNHGGALFDVDGRNDFSGEFDQLAASLRKGFGRSPGVERELRYRRSIAVRSHFSLLMNHVVFRSACKPEYDENNAVREWLLGRLRGRERIRIGAQEDAFAGSGNSARSSG